MKLPLRVRWSGFALATALLACMPALRFDIVVDSRQSLTPTVQTVQGEIAKWGRALREAKIRVE